MKTATAKFFFGILLAPVFCLAAADADANGDTVASERVNIQAKLNTLQIPFIINQGQMHEHVAFRAKALGGTMFVTKNGELVYALHEGGGEHGKSVAIRESLQAARTAKPRGELKSPSKVNYFKGQDPKKWRTEVPTFDCVNLGEVYSGIEMAVKAYGNNVEKLFSVKPGADPELIRVSVEGAMALHVTSRGELAMTTELGTVTFTKPSAYQEIDGTRHHVDVGYEVTDRTYAFKLGNYDKNNELVIDPMLSTFLGGSGLERGNALEAHYIDGLYVYVTGYTESRNDFPDKTGVQTAFGGGDRDAFVARLDSDLRTLNTTYLGGKGDDEAWDIAVHPETHHVYVVGSTNSTDFPTAPAAGRGRGGGEMDGFITRLTPDLSAIEQSRYLGGNYKDYVRAITIDHNLGPDPLPDWVYVAGRTFSDDFPSTTGSAQPQDGSCPSLSDGFVARLGLDLNLLKASYLGGNSTDSGYAVAVHGLSKDVYVAGDTHYDPRNSDTANDIWLGSFPWVPADSFGGQVDTFVVRLKYDLTEAFNATYLGGAGIEFGTGLAVNVSEHKIYVAGGTSPAYDWDTHTYWNDFPANGYQTAYGGDQDAYVARFNADLTTLEKATYLGGTYFERAGDIVLDNPNFPGSDVYVLGKTRSANFPGTEGGANPKRGGDEAFVARLDDDLTVLEQGTFVGGSGFDESLWHGMDLGNDSHGARLLFITGQTSSGDFPAVLYTDLDSTAQPTLAGSTDAFVVRLSPLLTRSGPADIELQPRDYDFGNVPLNQPAYPQLTVIVENMGGSTLNVSDIFLTGDDRGDYQIDFTPLGATTACGNNHPSVASGENCTLNVIFTPSVDNDYRTAELVVQTDNDSDEPEVRITLSGYSGPDIELAPAQAGHEARVVFPVMEIGTSIKKTFTIKNVGHSDLEVTSIQKYGVLPHTGEDFTLHFGGGYLPCQNPATGSLTLSRNHYCTVEVEFAPTVFGMQEAVVVIESNDLNEPLANVYLEGTGVEDLDADIWSHDLEFGDVATGNSRSLALLISNTGGMPLELTGFTPSDTANFLFDYDGGAVPCASMGDTIPSTDYCTVMVTFEPTAQVAGAVEETLTIHSNDPDEPDFIVRLTGRGGQDSDQDGVLDLEEDGDANGDSISDAVQPHVAAFHSVDGQHFVVLESSGGSALKDVRPVTPPDEALPPSLEGYEFPFGFFHFKVAIPPAVSGTDVKITLPEGETAYTYVKWGPEPDRPTHNYYNFGDETKYPGAVEIDGNEITLHLVDGGAGDHDLEDNNEIADPGAPATKIAYRGDVDDNGLVKLDDAVLALKVCSGLAQDVNESADVNDDDKIGIAEVIYILQSLAGLR